MLQQLELQPQAAGIEAEIGAVRLNHRRPAEERPDDPLGGPDPVRTDRRFVALRHRFPSSPDAVRNHAWTARGHPAILSPSRSEEHTSELQSLMRISYAVFCLKKHTHTLVRLIY